MARRSDKPEKLWLVSELAEAWGVSPNFVYDAISTKALVRLDLNNGKPQQRAMTRVRQSEVEAYLARCSGVVNRERRLHSVEDVAS